MFMQVQINSDSNIAMHGKLSDAIGAYINNLLQRFDPYLTRVEVNLRGDKSAKKLGPQGKRCVLEARAKRHQPLVVTNKSADIDAAFAGAAVKMHRQLETTYGRLADKRRRKHTMERNIDNQRSSFAE
jgi:ribosome-associated translation inhibitor RaiA